MQKTKQWMATGLAALVVGAGAFAAGPARADYPEKPVTIVVPYAAGGPTDFVARLLAEQLGRNLRQTFLIDNKGGAGGNLGAQYVARMPPDGYTLLMNAAAHSANMAMYDKPGFDARKSFAPITLLVRAPTILLASPGFAPNNIAELLAAARKDPGKYSYGSAGVGTATHLSMELFKQMAGIDIVHIPYRGGAPATADLMGGQIPLMMDSMVTGLKTARSGKVKVLGMTGVARSAVAEDIPTIAEQGVPGMQAYTWYGVVAPAGTPDKVVALLNTQINAILADPEFKKKMLESGAEPMGMSAKAFGDFIDAETVKWAAVVKKAGVRAE
ncbi:MAG: tripartite tricarboxylate transporter substrate binding protein [Pseudomonadota bacterium]